MARGRLESPNLDDRTWQDIVDQARALIPTYAPQWTDHNPSDLGISLIELFAWLVESLTYRLNRVPEKMMIEFFNLIGITRDPATPAATWLVCRLADGAPTLDLPAGYQVATPQTDATDSVVFESDEAATILGINLSKALLLYRTGTDNPPRYRDITSRIVAAPLTGLAETIGSQGLATASVIIALGFDAAIREQITLRVQLSRPFGAQAAQVDWQFSRGQEKPGQWFDPGQDPQKQLVVEDGTQGLQKNGPVRFGGPVGWGAQNPSDWDYQPEEGTQPVTQPLFWIGIRIARPTDAPLQIGVVQILFNAVPATNALTVTRPELLGTSNGRPFQYFDLRFRPLYKQVGSATPYGHLRLQVREPQVGGGFGQWNDWRLVADFPEGAAECFRLDPVTGRVDFGNFSPSTSPAGHGTIPPPGSEIQALTYRYVAGDSRGNVPPDTVTVMRSGRPGLIAVTNPGPATGGSDEEPVEETQRRAPEDLRNRNRAVTAEDYEFLAREATTDVQKVRCLPERLFRDFDALPPGAVKGDPWTYGGLNRDKGNVNLIVIPAAPDSDATPLPSEQLLQEVKDYLDARRVVGTNLHVTGPRYLPIDVTATVLIWDQAVNTGLVENRDKFADQMKVAIARFLHPLHGGPQGAGWEIGQAFLVSGLLEYIQPPPEIGFISKITVAPGAPKYIPPTRPVIGQPGVWVQLADYEIICSGVMNITASRAT
jgi:Baseplate J-like protein